MFSYFLRYFIFMVISVFEFNCKVYYNTYRVEVTRATVYQPYVIDRTCLLRPEEGPCRAKISMYYYEPSSGNCSTFLWGGCQGNGNRFDTHDECIGNCLSSPRSSKSRPKWCSLTFDYGFCFGALNRWYYDPLWQVCKQRIFSGCGGNKNNFYSKEQCDSVCRFGNGIITSTTKGKDNMKKVLILNPLSLQKGTKLPRNRTDNNLK